MLAGSMMKNTLRTLAFALVAATLPAVGQAQEKVLTIPFAGPVTGPIATYGLEVVHGALVAVEEVNAAGGIQRGPWKGYKIKIEIHDDRGDPAEAANIAQQLVLDENVPVMLGHIFSSSCLSALPIYEQAGLSMVTPICSNPMITEMNYKTAIRLVQDDNANGVGQMNLAVRTLGGKNLGILYANNDYGRGLAEIGANRAKELGVTFISEPYNEGETDYNAIIGRFKAAKVDMIVHYGFYTEAALQRRQAMQQGFDVVFLAGPGSVSTEFIKLGGKAVEGVYVVDFLKEDLGTAKLKQLASRVMSKFKEGFNLYHRNGYDAISFIVAALESAKEKSRAASNASLLKTEIKGLTYDLKLTAKGNLIVPMDRLEDYFVLKVVKGGKFVDYVK